MKNKEYALKLLKQKLNGEISIAYKEISNLTGYSKRQLIRLNIDIEKKDISTLDNPIYSILVSTGAVEDAVADIFLNYQQYGNVVTSHKTIKKLILHLQLMNFIHIWNKCI